MVHVGERLSAERVRKGYSLEEVSKATKIRVSFLVAIENGEYKKLPSSAYAHGFVRNYARFLNLPEREILAIFKREYSEDSVVKVLPEGLAQKNDFPLSGFRAKQALKVFFLIFTILLIYIIFQYRSAIFNPSLNVYSPKENSIIYSQAVTVTGKTDPNSIIFINSIPASLDKDGSFKKTISLFSGKTKITIKSVNNFNRVTILERHVEIKI